MASPTSTRLLIQNMADGFLYTQDTSSIASALCYMFDFSNLIQAQVHFATAQTTILPPQLVHLTPTNTA